MICIIEFMRPGFGLHWNYGTPNGLDIKLYEC